MKKLMIAAAIVCAAAMTQAAQFTWKTNGKAFSIGSAVIKEGLSAGHYSIPASGANADTMSNQMASPEASSNPGFGATWQYSILFTNPDGTKIDGVQPLTGDILSGNFSSRAINLTSLVSDLVVQDLENPKKLGYEITITGTLTDGKGKKWQLTSDALVGKDATAWAVQGGGTPTLTTTGPQGWTVAAVVPEPTSGLLLLLGVAGLALKRRRA